MVPDGTAGTVPIGMIKVVEVGRGHVGREPAGQTASTNTGQILDTFATIVDLAWKILLIDKMICEIRKLREMFTLGKIRKRTTVGTRIARRKTPRGHSKQKKRKKIKSHPEFVNLDMETKKKIFLSIYIN